MKYTKARELPGPLCSCCLYCTSKFPCEPAIPLQAPSLCRANARGIANCGTNLCEMKYPLPASRFRISCLFNSESITVFSSSWVRSKVIWISMGATEPYLVINAIMDSSLAGTGRSCIPPLDRCPISALNSSYRDVRTHPPNAWQYFCRSGQGRRRCHYNYRRMK